LLAVNPYHIWYSQEARMFAWATLVATFAMYAFVRAARGGSWLWWAMQGVCIGLTMHLHYYVVWLLCAQDVFLLVILWRSRHRGLPSSGQLLRGALLSHALFVLLAAPAVAVYLTKSRTYNQWGWLADRYGAPGLENLATLAQVFLGGVAVPNVPRIVWPVVLAGVAMAALGAFAALRALFRADDTRLAAAVCAVCLCVPLVIVLVIGQFRPFWIPRHFLLFLPLFLILLSMGIDVLAASGSLGWCTGLGIATAVLALGLIGGARIYGQPQKEQWREVAAYLDATRRHDDRLVLMDAECRVPLAHYGGEPADVEISRFASADELSNAVSALRDMPEGSRIHAVVSHADASALYTLLDAASELELEAQPHFVGIEVRTYRWL